MAFVFSGFALSNEPSNYKAVTQKEQIAKEKQEYPKLDTSSLEKAIRESIKEASEKPDPQAAHKLQIDGEMVKYTGQLSDFTMWLVIVTGVLAVVAIWQGVQLKRTVIVTENAAEAIPKIERAYVFATVKRIVNVSIGPSGTANVSAIVSFFNHGKTPAIITMLRAYSGIFEFIPHELLEGTNERLPEGLVIASGESFPLPVDISISNTEAMEVEGLAKCFYCVGMIEYKDILGDIRETGFCWEYRQSEPGGFIFCRKSKLNYCK